MLKIPTIDPTRIQTNELDSLMQIGFCYVQLSNDILHAKIKKCVRVARDFFQQPVEEKTKWRLKEVLTAADRYQGYALRSQSKNTNAIEQFFFEPDAPFGPYETYSSYIKSINTCFTDTITQPIIQAIFNRLNLEQTDFIDATTDTYRSLVFQSCPAIGIHKEAIRLNAHKDFGLLTVLFFEEAGLEVQYENDWHAIAPQKNCVVINIGNALQLMTNGRCHSALHRVINATDNRLSMVYFVSPNYKKEVRNYVDNTIIAPTGELFFKQQFAEYYETPH